MFLSSFYDYYFQNFAKNKVFITIRDIVEYVFMVVVAFFFKNKYQGFIKAFLKVIKKSKIQSNNAIVNMNVRSLIN